MHTGVGPNIQGRGHTHRCGAKHTGEGPYKSQFPERQEEGWKPLVPLSPTAILCLEEISVRRAHPRVNAH